MRPVYGESLVRFCPLVANPPAKYLWRRYGFPDNVEVNVSTDVEFAEDGRRMNIPAYKPELHNGLYYCSASNALGSFDNFTDFEMFYLHTECKSTPSEPDHCMTSLCIAA